MSAECGDDVVDRAEKRGGVSAPRSPAPFRSPTPENGRDYTESPSAGSGLDEGSHRGGRHDPTNDLLDLSVLVHPERLRLPGHRMIVVQPLLRGPVASIDQLLRVPEVSGRHVEGTQRGQHMEFDGRLEPLHVGDELLVQQQ